MENVNNHCLRIFDELNVAAAVCVCLFVVICSVSNVGILCVFFLLSSVRSDVVQLGYDVEIYYPSTNAFLYRVSSLHFICIFSLISRAVLVLIWCISVTCAKFEGHRRRSFVFHVVILKCE